MKCKHCGVWEIYSRTLYCRKVYWKTPFQSHEWVDLKRYSYF